MKIMIFVLITVVYSYSPFCSGYKVGFKAGYCHNKTVCFAPMPFCPSPGFGESTYQDGYNRGFVDGMRR
jgi:hypothetical protein